MNPFTRRVLFVLFFLSGLCSLVYQVAWTRLAFASFGIITPVLSVVLSVFMLGLALGSWLGGRLIPVLSAKTNRSGIYFYALAELFIGLGAFVVPVLFDFGVRLLLGCGAMNSFPYLLLSAGVLALSILPFCLCMGTTFPFMMAFIRQHEKDNPAGFSYLYLANVLGAMTGTLFTALIWIELLGFRHSLALAAGGNFVIGFIAICIELQQPKSSTSIPVTDSITSAPPSTANLPRLNLGPTAIKWILFATGFISMAMEVVWTRAFTPVLKTQVYSFALIIFTYLTATFAGSFFYRQGLRRRRVISIFILLPAVALAALLPVIINDGRLVVADWLGNLDPRSALLILLSICPFCALLGYLTPSLIDQCAQGAPTPAGRAYAINVIGCVLGPLVAGYLLLPNLSERLSLITLATAFALVCLACMKTADRTKSISWITAFTIALIYSCFGVEDFETHLTKIAPQVTVRRDYAASVISMSAGSQKRLLVNGIGMTALTPITKFMVHIPMAMHSTPPKSALIICFGMGTSFRSALSWGIDTTAVELVPSVVKAFGFYHANAADCLLDPHGHIVVDDGRRFLRRTSAKYDTIVVDPPPPVWAAGSSLLYSKEFYALARQHLNPGGILQIWYPGGDVATGQAALRSITESFPNVCAYESANHFGIFMFASDTPLPQLNAAQMLARMPADARQDLFEWNNTGESPTNYINQNRNGPLDIPRILSPDPDVIITDDHPFNEYFLLRHWIDSGNPPGP